MMKKITEAVRNPSILLTTGGLVLLSFASRIVGLLRDRLLTSEFGVGGILDSYFSAFRIPDLIYNFLILGTLSSAFIPVFSKLLHKKDGLEDAQELVDDVFVIVAAVMGSFSVLMFIFAPSLTRIVAQSYGPDKFADTVLLTRVMAFSPLIFSLSSIVTSVLQTYKRFFAAALAPIFYNGGIILGIVFLYPMVGVIGLGYGVVLGALFHFLVQVPALVMTGFPFRFTFGFNWSNLRRLWKLYWPRLLVIDVTTISIFIGTSIASTQADAVTIFTLAFNLNALPLGVLAVSFATAIFPYLSEAYAKDDEDAFRKYLAGTVSRIIFVLIPVMVLMLLFRAQLVRIVYGAGAFDWRATTLTFQTFTIFALSIPFQGLIPLFARALYARHDTITPMVVGIGGMILNGVLSWALIQRFDVLGVAGAFSITIVTICLVYAGVVFRKINHGTINGVFAYSLKVGLVSLIMGLVVQGLKMLVTWLGVNDDTLIMLILIVGGIGSIGMGLYWIVSKKLGLTKVLSIN